MALVGAPPERNNLRHDDAHLWETRKHIIEKSREIVGCRGRITMADVIRADMEQNDVRLVSLQPAININTAFNLRNCPAGMALIVRIGYGPVAAPLRSHEVNGVAIFCEENPEHVTVAAVALIGSTQGD